MIGDGFTLRLVRPRLGATVLIVPVELDDDLVIALVGMLLLLRQAAAARVGRRHRLHWLCHL